MIRGAGILLWRERRPLELEVALIHRPRYEDWTFPKGGVDVGENPLQAAYRECIEETGISPVVGAYLGEVIYKTEAGKKRVDYWMGRASGEEVDFVPNSEVDKLSWISVKEARHFLTYDDDKSLLSQFIKIERHINTLVLLRHAKAVKREDWFGEDSDRPLSHKGELQSAKLASLFPMFSLTETHTSDAQRCLKTVEPIAASLQLTVVRTPILSEDYYEKDDNGAIEYLMQLLKFNRNQLVCSHNPIFNDMLMAFTNHSNFARHLPKLSPADSWVIHHAHSRIVSVDTLPAPIVEKNIEKD